MPELFPICAVGYIRSRRTAPQDDDWDRVEARIELDEGRFGPEAVTGLAAFSHLEVLFLFHKAAEPAETGARHPRGRTDWPKTGIFAQRAKDRPNRIGATICRILSVHGTIIAVQGLDAIDGSPVIDLKPVMSAFLPRGPIREPEWSKELMQYYWTV